MNICTLINENCNFHKFEQFIKTAYVNNIPEKCERILVIDNSDLGIEINNVFTKLEIDNYEIIKNGCNLNIPASINQAVAIIGHGFILYADYYNTVFAGSEWIDKSEKIDSSVSLSGDIYNKFIINNETVYEIIDGLSDSGVDWMSSATDDGKNIKIINKNAFIIGSDSFKELGMFNSFNFHNLFMEEFCLRSYRNGKRIEKSPSIYSDEIDRLRFDVFQKVFDGCDIISPVVNNSVREKFCGGI